MNKKNPLLILAPMAGITDLPFRLICKKYKADLVYSEMISATGLFYNSKKTEKLLQTTDIEQPVVMQLFGNDPSHFVKATKIINKKLNKNKENQIDINFGCPVKKIIKQGAGCVLMEKPDLAKKIIQAVSENTNLPISIKIRAGIENTNALNFIDKVADLNWKTVIIHGRTFEQGFTGSVDFNLIKEIKEKYPKKNIIANGGINTPEDAKNILEKTEVNGIALAQGVLGKPWIFKQINDYLKMGKYSSPSINLIKKTVLDHLKLFIKYQGENNIQEFRKHLGWYFKGIEGAKKIRKNLFKIKNSKEVIEIVNKIN